MTQSPDTLRAAQMAVLEQLRFDAQGLIPVIIQNAVDGLVLTLAYANREAIEKTITTGETHLYSRSRNELWHKGATSGNVQRVIEISTDCDQDAVLYRALPAGPACHTGATSCFFTEVFVNPEDSTVPPTAQEGDFAKAMAHLQTTIKARRNAAVDESYVATLLARGVDLIGKKIGEEAMEVVIAAKNADHKEIVWEVADLLFHTIVLLEASGVSLDEVGHELLRRAK